MSLSLDSSFRGSLPSLSTLVMGILVQGSGGLLPGNHGLGHVFPLLENLLLFQVGGHVGKPAAGGQDTRRACGPAMGQTKALALLHITMMKMP